VASLLLAAIFALAWTASGDHEVVERIVLVEKEAPAPVLEEPIDVSTDPEVPCDPWLNYARDCRIVMSRGVEGLPELDLRPIADPGSPPWDPLHEATLDARPEG